MGGSQPLDEPYFKSSVFRLYRKRIIWLLILFVAEAYTGTVLRHYEETLSEVIALAFFIPLLIGTGGNTGTQTVSTLVRALAVGEVHFRDIFKVIRKEVTTGLMTGATISLIAFGRAYILGVHWNVGLVVALAALTIVLWASFVAAILPLILHKLKADPAVVSSPFITTLVDGTGLVIYFTLAKIILHL
ncbi:magnesium transporter [Paenibacillus sp. D2_2]|nr:magnesium transporter [Paenibacillus sp. D2_2]WMT38828.1 magnesium transporter [Paenibacillus sp. D2_2]